jgi:hypothetical protein
MLEPNQLELLRGGMMSRTAMFFVVCGTSLMVFSAGCNKNEPPATPQLGGPTTGNAGDTLTFTFSTTDPENQELEYMIAWGDTSAVSWSPLYPSGQQITRTHVFADSGAYHVKVKARDTRQAESEWCISRDVSIVLLRVGPPSAVAASSGPGESDSTVLISWTAPADSTPDKYTIYFRPFTDSDYVVIGETTGTSCFHNPYGMTGQYKVAAIFGADTYESSDKPSTVPIPSDAITLFEINADASRCGFGWTRDSGVGGVFAMTESANCARVDFYVSDLQAGVGGPLTIVSPNKAKVDSLDPGAVGIVPAAAWRTNGFSNPLVDPQNPLPGYQPPPNANYFIYTQISRQPCYIACYTAGETVKHYAVIQVDSVDVSTGRVWMKSWFQLVPGLRLIRH